ncbi:MAG: DinB family protein [Anaerolineaceae bacterium]|nr:DinB family protein [Anaerolineaceae bacterium]
MSAFQYNNYKHLLLEFFTETFESVKGIYLDKNTSLFETLTTISAEQASIPVGGKCATIAAQVKHIAFYLEVIEKAILDPNSPRADWDEVWRTVGVVSESEWQAIQDELRSNYNRILDLIKSTNDWPVEDEVGEMIAVIVHTAYHLGEIRQALCIILK